MLLQSPRGILPRLVPSRYLCVVGGERRLGVRLAIGQRCHFPFVPSHETPRVPQPNPQSSLKNGLSSDLLGRVVQSWVKITQG